MCDTIIKEIYINNYYEESVRHGTEEKLIKNNKIYVKEKKLLMNLSVK